MRPAMWTSYLVELSPEDMVATFADKEWRELELSTEHGAALLERGDPAATGEAFRRYASDRGVSFPQGHLWIECDIVTDDTARLDDLKRWLDLFVGVGVSAGVLHPGGGGWLREGRPVEEVDAKRTESLAALADHLKGTGLDVCLENMAAKTAMAGELIAIIESTGREHLAICLDTGHLNVAGGSQGDFIREAGPLLKALHIANTEGERDQHLMPYGRGKVAWGEVATALKEIGYAGLYTFEIPGENRCPMAARLAKLDYLRAILPILLEGEAA